MVLLVPHPLSSTRQFNTRGVLLFSPPESVSSTQKSRSSTHLSVQHQKTVSSIHKTLQINTPISSTHPSVRHSPQFNLKKKKPSVQHHNWRACWTEGYVELEDLLNWGMCWTEWFLVLNWRILGSEKVWSLCWSDVLNWRGLCWTEELNFISYYSGIL